MSGAQISIDIDDGAVADAISRLYARGGNLAPALRVIGAKMVASTQHRFETERDPEEHPWAELKPSTQRRIVRGRPRGSEHILVDRGHLVNSITYLATPSELAVGTNRVYGAIHQLGGTDDMAPGPAGIPARPFLGVSGEDERAILHVLTDHLAGAL